MNAVVTRPGDHPASRFGIRPTRRVVAPEVRRRRRVQLTWALLVLNVMTFFPGAPHLLRATFATRLAERGVDVRTIQDLLGHTNLNTTQRYVAVTDERRRAAVAVLD